MIVGKSDRSIFSRFPKQLTVRFHTSSMEKFLQARVVFQRHGLTLGYFRESQEPYREEYELGQRTLLQKALDEIRSRVGANSLFFVEDTSVKVDALSDGSVAYPGLKVKEWFKNTTFGTLDTELRCRGNDRAATVYSDIGLYVPELERAVFVHGETSGSISERPPSFETSYRFPWLTPNTFNGWFVPDGSNKALGEMEFEESFRYDFRVKSLTALLERIEEYAAIVNLPTKSYAVLKPNVPDQEWLFPKQSPLILVIGRVCAGKTTFGEHLSSEHNGFHVEASDELTHLAHEAGISSSEDAFSRASELLRSKGPDVVAKSICRRYHYELESGAIITGFRAIEEVIYFRNRYTSCIVVFVDAGDRIRCSRHLERGRLDGIRTFDDFHVYDRQQWQFGLLARAREVVDVPRDVADIQVTNEGTLKQYYAQIDALLDRLGRPGGLEGPDKGVHDVPGVCRLNVEPLQERRIFRCLRALGRCQHPMTCSEIRERMAVEGSAGSISDRHLNWVLVNVPGLARRVSDGAKLRYEILSAGRAYVEAIKIQSLRTKGRGDGRTD